MFHNGVIANQRGTARAFQLRKRVAKLRRAITSEPQNVKKHKHCKEIGHVSFLMVCVVRGSGRGFHIHVIISIKAGKVRRGRRENRSRYVKCIRLAY